MSKQSTLFRAWGCSKKPRRDAAASNRKAPIQLSLKNPVQTASSNSHNSNQGQRGVSTSTHTAHVAIRNAGGRSHDQQEQYGFDDFQELDDFFEDDISDEIERGPASSGSRDEPVSVHNTSILEDIPGFDAEAGGQWIYPVNYPIRDYQFNIVQKCLFKNTLVCLPTGLGKTFIAAVVMFNFYRWYPDGKVVFLAPTKPLVAQQIEACHNIMGIPQTHLAEMTGNLPPKERVSQWASKRVFFLTPQVMQNDIARGACPAGQVCCVVFDEAHKALGNHSYCQVVRELSSCGGIFRVLALSATPGNDLKAVQQVVSNLLLSHIELRSEDSFDIQPYTHQRRVELSVVPLEGEILLIKNAFLKVLSGVIGRLAKYGVVYSANPERLSKFALLQARDGFRQCPPSNVHAGSVESDFAAAISLYHAFDLLLQHGMRSFHQYLTHTFTVPYSRTKAEIDRHPELSCVIRDLHGKLSGLGDHTDAGTLRVQTTPTNTGRSPRSSHYTSPRSTTTQFFYSHPKLRKLEEVVLEHFHRLDEQSSNSACSSSTAVQTRAMIFSQYRESVQEIADMLSCHAPLVRVMSFVGHGTTGKSTSKGLTQREQTEVVRKFREGGYNTLVATCVGEEGLDIGEVDLIVCFDAHKSPIRLVQRMGRTGRKRSGRIVVIVAQGKEEQIYRKSQSNKSSIHKAIRDSCRSLHFYPHAPRMLPRHITPQCLKMHMNVQEFVTKAERGTRGKGRGRGRQPRLSLGPPVLGKASQRGCLNQDELDHWSKNYSLPDRELRACERAVNDCYKPHTLLGLSHWQKEAVSSGIQESPLSNSTGPNCNTSTSTTPLTTSAIHKYTLSFSKWVRWQTAQTHFKVVGPSEKRKQFVSLLEFLDMMHSSEGLGDSYGTEMATFLHREDIHEDRTLNCDGRVGEKVRVCKRRRLPSDSSDDDFREEVGEAGGGEACLVETPDENRSEQDAIELKSKDEEHVSNQPSEAVKLPQEIPPSPCNNRRGSLQHAIPRPPSSESLDWLDSIEPSQVSTPLPAPLHHPPHTQTTSTDTFQFAFPRTPPSTRRGNPPIVTPFTAPLLPIRDHSTRTHRTLTRTHKTPQNVNADSVDLFSTTQSPSNVESVNLFDDISSAVLFEDFSDVSTSHAPESHKDMPMTVTCRPGTDDSEKVFSRIVKDDVVVRWDPNVTCIPDSEDEGDREGGGGGEGSVGEEGLGEDGARVCDAEKHSEPCIVASEMSSYSEDSLIVVQGKRARCARPDFLLTQAPPPHPDVCVISPDSNNSEEEGKWQEEKKIRWTVGRVDGSSDEDEFVAPLRRVTKRQGGTKSEDRQTSHKGSQRGSVKLYSTENQLGEEFDFLDQEAELSGDGGQNTEDSVEEDEDCYDMEDSFINDNSVLTQITPSQLARKRVRETRYGPVNMADVYRRSLMSPDTLFSGRAGGKVRGSQYRMVLSQRHHILHHYMEKAGERRRKKLFCGEGEEEVNVSGEGVEEEEGTSVSGEGVEGEEGTGEGVESEAEEVMVQYGEEDREELSGSQSIGEPWDWEEGEESQEVEAEGMRTAREASTGHSCRWQTLETDIVSPSLLASVELHSTPSCYTLEVEGWLSEGSGSSEELPPAAGQVTGELDTEPVVLSQQELEEEFARFSDPISPWQTEFSPPLPAEAQTKHTQPAESQTEQTHPVESQIKDTQPVETSLPCDSISGPKSTLSASVETSAEATCNSRPLTFLTSSVEASHTQVVSVLRHKHRVCVLVCPLGHSGYIISNRTVVERREVREVGSATSTSKLISRLQELKNLYLRVCVILEEPAAKEGRKTWYKPSHYVETAVSRLLSTGVHVLFSQSQSHSASLLATLGSSEAVRGHTISLTEQHTQAVQPAVMKLLQCLPGMSCLTALSMATAFTSLKELLHCSVEDLRRRAPSLTERRARELVHFFRHSFNPHLVP